MRARASPLDRFIPHPDVGERFETTIRAPADCVMAVACGFDLMSPPLVRAIFRLREVVLRATPAPREPRGLLEETAALGWGLLDEAPGRFVVCGARCQPWLPEVTFRALPPAEFASYGEPDQVKIAWTLETQDAGAGTTRFVHETRVVGTDAAAKEKFRRYWRWARFGIVAIRLLVLPAIRRAAEQRREAQREPR